MSIFGRRNNGELVMERPIFVSNRNWLVREMEDKLPNIKTVKIFGKNYDIKIEFENINTPELNMKENYIIELIVPKKYKKIGTEAIEKMAIEKMYEQIAEKELEDLMEKTRIKFGIAPEEYILAPIKNSLGKCIDGKTIIINPELMQFKREIREYVVAHQFCHLKYKSHGKRFYEMIQKNIPNYIKLEREIYGYEI